MFNIINRKTLLEYCKRYPDAAIALQSWYHELLNAEFKNFHELKKVYGNVSLVGDDRVVFNILGNKYRLVVRMVFVFKAIQINGLAHTQSTIRLMLLPLPIKRNNDEIKTHKNQTRI